MIRVVIVEQAKADAETSEKRLADNAEKIQGLCSAAEAHLARSLELAQVIQQQMTSGLIASTRERIGMVRCLDTKTLLAVNDIKPNGMAYGWESTGGDPQLIVPASTIARHIRLRFSAVIVNSGDFPGGKFQLFFDHGGGFSEADSYVAYFTGSEIKIDTNVSMGGAALCFRLDPVDSPCEFVIQEFTIEPCGALEVILRNALRSVQRLYRKGQLGSQLVHAGRSILRGKFGHALGLIFDSGATSHNHYARFIEERRVDAPLRKAFVAKAETFGQNPVLSVIMPTYNSPPEFLERAIQSIVAQTYPHWELCIADDGSPKRDIVRPVLDRLSALDSRIKVEYLDKNGGISNASNAALALATGDYIALFDHDDEIQPHAFHAIADAINRHPEADWIYSDEDKIDTGDVRFGPFFKPDWSPAYFLSCMYTCHLGVYRRSMVEELGGFRPEFDTAQDYDLALRFANRTRNVIHIPDVLYHWRTLPESTASGADAKPEAELRARKAVQDHVDRGRYKGQVEAGPIRGTHRVKFDIVGEPLVSIAIPSAGYRTTADGRDTWFVLELVRSIREKTVYRNIEIVIADNDDFDPALIAALEPLRVKRVHYKSDLFNMSDKMNLVVGAASGDYVVLLNDDMSVINGDWIAEMLMWAQQEDVVGVGAKLLFPDGRIQHAGVLMLGQGPSHPYYLHDGATIGLVCNAVVPHEVSVVTGACMMVRRADYLAIGGFNPDFRVNYNDVDFCLRLTETTGKRIVWTPYAQLLHYESVSREAAPEHELAAINARWAHVIGNDPFYNRNLSQSSASYEISPYVRSIIEDYDLVGKS